MQQTVIEILAEAAIGLFAGLLGGLLGIGGSVIMIPGLAVLMGSRDPNTQHLFQAAAMAVNVAVAAPAAIRHAMHGAVNKRMTLLVLPSATVFIVVGVLLSNQIGGLALRRIFAAFLVYVAFSTLFKATRRAPDFPLETARITPLRSGAVGSVMGFAAGLLGVGGGVLAVPLALTLCKVPLRTAIGVSSTAMCLTATVGATLKISTLSNVGQSPLDALVLAASMAPTAILGGWLGARLTHRLPLQAVRVVLLILLLLAAFRMAAPPTRSEGQPSGIASR